jgi:phosphatidylglycerol:prolipoprotein diacylglycerol transferase
VVSVFLQATTILVPGQLRLGTVRVPVYGVFAAAGLIAALGLSLTTARRVGLAAEELWDAGLFGVVAAFVLSRLLLIGGDVRGFLQLPLVMLALPSFTYGGMVLTALAVASYLQWKRLPVLKVLDAWAPCAAVLAAMLNLGRFFEGDEVGMPARLSWGIHRQPVAVYAAVAAVVLGVVLMWLLQRRLQAGMVAGVGLVAGGAVGFLLDMMTQPMVSGGSAWLDPVQWVAVGAMLVGGLMLTFLKEIA